MGRKFKSEKPYIIAFCEGESEKLILTEDNDYRNKWLCENCATFSTVQEAIEFLSA